MFINTLQRLNRGGSLHELDTALLKLTQQCRVTGKPGTLTLKLKMKPVDAAGDMMEIADSISVSTPEMPRKAALFYADDDGSLSRNDPRQPDLIPPHLVEGAEQQPQTNQQSAAAI